MDPLSRPSSLRAQHHPTPPPQHLPLSLFPSALPQPPPPIKALLAPGLPQQPFLSLIDFFCLAADILGTCCPQTVCSLMEAGSSTLACQGRRKRKAAGDGAALLKLAKSFM